MSLILGKCLDLAMKQTVRVLVPRLKFDSFLTMYFREPDELLAFDPEDRCKPGDWILVRELPERLSLKVKHRVEKMVHEAGNIIDPITGKKSVGYQYEDDIRTQNKWFGLDPLNKRKFNR